MSVPKLRFKEFQGEWEVKKLEKLLFFKNGINAAKEQYGKGIKFINVMDIINNDFITYDNIIGCVDVTEKVFEESKVEYGDVLFQRSSETREEVGQASVYVDKNKSATFGGFVIRGKKIGEYNPIFINFLLKTDLIRKDITDKSGGSTRYNVGQDTLKTVDIHLPSIAEQTKIADFLISIDEKIAQLTQKCELLARYKKGVMQQLFNQELRFKDDDGCDFTCWKEKTLGDILSIFPGYAFSSNDSRPNGVKWLKIADIGIQNMTATNPSYLPNEFRDKYNNFLVFKNDYVVALTRPILNGKLKIAKVNDYYNESLLNQRVGKLVTDQEIDFVYFILQLENTVSQISDIISGSDPPNLSLNEIKGINLKIPTDVKEQMKIAKFLISIDEKITESQTYLETVKQYKQGLLQQMFV